MKLIDIAFKDISRTFRSVFSLVMMFGAPLLITGLLYFAFGGLASGGDGFNMPVTRVQLVNLDEPDAGSNAFSAGEMLVDFFENEDLAGVLEITIVDAETEARAAVEDQQAGIALIIPPGFSAAALDPNREASVTLYQDPTLTISPQIVKGLVNHFLDGFSGSKIAAEVTSAQLRSRDVSAGAVLSEKVAGQYSA